MAFLLQNPLQSTSELFSTNNKQPLQSNSFVSSGALGRGFKGVLYDLSALSEGFQSSPSVVVASTTRGGGGTGTDSNSSRVRERDEDSDRNEDSDAVGTEDVRLGSSGSLTWTGDINSLRKYEIYIIFRMPFIIYCPSLHYGRSLRGIESRVQQLGDEQAQRQKLVGAFPLLHNSFFFR